MVDVSTIIYLSILLCEEVNMDKNLGRLISILYRKNTIQKSLLLKKIDITASEQPFLSTLYYHNGVSQEFLSSFLSIDKAATARAIQSLIDKGLVVKAKDNEDKRVNRIFLTEKGMEIKKPLQDTLDNLGEIITKNMSEAEINKAYALLEKMVKNVEEELGKCKEK